MEFSRIEDDVEGEFKRHNRSNTSVNNNMSMTESLKQSFFGGQTGS